MSFVRIRWVTAASLGALVLGSTPALAANATGSISGVVKNAKTGERLANAIVVLQCTCLPGSREATTNAQGLYAFRNLPQGTFAIQVLAGESDVSKVTTLPEGARFRANFKLDPKAEFKRSIRVAPTSASRNATFGQTVSQDPFARTTSAAPREPSPKAKLAEHREVMAAQRGPETTTAPSAAPLLASPTLETEHATSPLPKDYARQVVYSGAMSLAVFDADAAKERAEAMVVKAGGYVQSMQEGTMVVRVPATRFRTLAKSVGGLGRVDAQAFEALDVTENYYDLQTRIEVLRRTQQQLLTLLDRARTVEEALKVRAALDEVTLSLESALGKQRLLVSKVTYSALSLSFTRRLPDTDRPSSNDPFPWVDDISVEGTAWR